MRRNELEMEIRAVDRIDQSQFSAHHIAKRRVARNIEIESLSIALYRLASCRRIEFADAQQLGGALILGKYAIFEICKHYRIGYRLQDRFDPLFLAFESIEFRFDVGFRHNGAGRIVPKNGIRLRALCKQLFAVDY